MVYTYSRYIRSVVEIFTPKATPERSHPQLNITTLPPIIIDLILSNLTTTDLSHLINASRFLRTLVRSHIALCRQRALERKQSLSIAANLPNELLQEIFSYLGPLDFYNSTRACSAWRGAGSYTRLVRKNVFAEQPASTVPPPGHLDGDLKTLAFYLLCNGQLSSGVRAGDMGKAVSTLYCKNPGFGSPLRRVFSNDSGYEPGLVPEPLPYPEIHLSEDGHYFLSVETAYPFQVHIYCTYRAVLSSDTKSCRNQKSFHPWDTTPTHLLTLPETGRVVSASFGKAMRGGLEFDGRTKSYSKGVDLLVLFEGQRAQLYKIRPTNKNTKSKNGTTKWQFGGCLFNWMAPAKPPSGRKSTYKWMIWDSMVFEGVCPLQQGPIKAKLGERSEKVYFAGEGGLEVWEGVGDMKILKVSGGLVWDKNAARRKLIPIVSMPGKVAGIYTGRIWDSGVGADVDYIVCSNTIHGIPEEELEGRTLYRPRDLTAALTPDRGTTRAVSEIACTSIITPTEVFIFNYTNFTQILGGGALQFVCLTPSYELSHLQLRSALDTPSSLNRNTDASGSAFNKLFSLSKKSDLGFPSSGKVTHIAAINVPSLSSSSPITVTAMDSGIVYISTPRPHHPSSTACASSPSSLRSSPSNRFQKIACIPPDTGGRITDLKISFRGPVWASLRRPQLLSEDAEPKADLGGMVVVVVATDRGRAEVCYFNFCNNVEGEGNVLVKSEAGRVWDLSGELVTPRVIGGNSRDRKAKRAGA